MGVDDHRGQRPGLVLEDRPQGRGAFGFQDFCGIPAEQLDCLQAVGDAMEDVVRADGGVAAWFVASP
jgi:hypothetical protein